MTIKTDDIFLHSYFRLSLEKPVCILSLLHSSVTPHDPWIHCAIALHSLLSFEILASLVIEEESFIYS